MLQCLEFVADMNCMTNLQGNTLVYIAYKLWCSKSLHGELLRPVLALMSENIALKSDILHIVCHEIFSLRIVVDRGLCTDDRPNCVT